MSSVEVRRLHILTWRAKAEELRTMADGMTHESARLGMLNAAAHYDQLADETEERDRVERLRSQAG